MVKGIDGSIYKIGVKPIQNTIIPECQAGFRKGYSTIDNFFEVHCRPIIQKHLNKKRAQFYCCFAKLLFKFVSIGVRIYVVPLPSRLNAIRSMIAWMV